MYKETIDLKKKLKRTPFLLTQPLRSRKQYFLGKLSVSGIIVIVLIICLVFWRSLEWYVLTLLTIVTMFIFLDLETIKFLFTSYDDYRKKWEKHNEGKELTSQ